MQLYECAVQALREDVSVGKGCTALSAILELRKVCNHPLLLKAPAEDVAETPWNKARKNMHQLAATTASEPLQQNSTKFALVAEIFLSCGKKDGTNTLRERVVIMSYSTTVKYNHFRIRHFAKIDISELGVAQAAVHVNGPGVGNDPRRHDFKAEGDSHQQLQ